MFKAIVRWPLFIPAVWVLITGTANLVLVKFTTLGKTELTVIGAAMWLFVGLTALYFKLDQSLQLNNAGATVARHEDLKNALLRTVSIYEGMPHPLMRDIFARQVADFSKDVSSEYTLKLTHQEFGFWLAPYVKKEVGKIQAFSRSWVTNWKKLGASSDAYRESQQGKDVTRIFVLEDAREYAEFQANVFPKHVAAFGADRMFVISKRQAAAIIADLPQRIDENEDFAIFDDKVVAFCRGDDVRVRVDKLETCRNVFAVVRGYAKRYDELQADPAKAAQLFGAQVT